MTTKKSPYDGWVTYTTDSTMVAELLQTLDTPMPSIYSGFVPKKMTTETSQINYLSEQLVKTEAALKEANEMIEYLKDVINGEI